MLKNKYESVKPLFEYIRTVPFDVITNYSKESSRNNYH